MRTFNLIWLLGTLIFSGCVTTMSQLTYEEREAISSTIFKAPYEVVFKAVIERALYKEWIISQADIKTGLITTEWKQSSSSWEVLTGEMRAKWCMFITEIDSNNTRERVQITGEQFILGGWQTIKLGKNVVGKLCNEHFEGIREILTGKK